MKIWRLTIEVITDGDNVYYYDHWFRTLIQLTKFKNDYDMRKRDNEGKYTSNVWKIEYEQKECEYEDIKDELTIAEYENLFRTEIKANRRLSTDDFEEGMWVWNQSERCYQQLRYISVKGKYKWVDGYGNVIENDAIYLYEKEDKDNE